MAEDLTPKIVRQYDSAEFLAGGRVRNTTVVQFVIGSFGPYEAIFDRAPDRFTVEQTMEKRRRELEGLI